MNARSNPRHPLTESLAAALRGLLPYSEIDPLGLDGKREQNQHRAEMDAKIDVGYQVLAQFDAEAVAPVPAANDVCGHSACSQNYIDTGSRECVIDSDLQLELDTAGWPLVINVVDDNDEGPRLLVPLPASGDGDRAWLLARRVVALVNGAAGVATHYIEEGRYLAIGQREHVGEDHPRYDEWREAVGQGDTLLGLADWLDQNPLEDEQEDESDT